MSDTTSFPGTMRGWAFRAYGEEMVLMDDLPVPAPGPHDILMQILSAEVGDWDELVRTGAWDMQRPFPFILGLAGAGRIAAVGAAATDFSAHQLVYAYSDPLHDNGAWAEFMLVADTHVAPIPASLTPVEAGGVPIVSLTAHETLIDVLRVTVDEESAFELRDKFTAAGFNLIDTTDVYSRWVPGHSGGESEVIIGEGPNTSANAMRPLSPPRSGWLWPPTKRA